MPAANARKVPPPTPPTPPIQKVQPPHLDEALEEIEPDLYLEDALLEIESDPHSVRARAWAMQWWYQAKVGAARLPPLARRLWAAAVILARRLWGQAGPLARRCWSQVGPRARRLTAALGPRGRVLWALARRLGEILASRLVAPITMARLWPMVAGTFVIGCGLGLAFATGPSKPTPAVALDRVQAAVALPPQTPPLPASDHAELPPAPAEVSPAELPEAPAAPKPSRAQLARQLALESFAAGDTHDGVSYFRIAVRSARRAPGDEVLIRQTLAALADATVAPSAEKVLRQLGPSARPLLAEAASNHPHPVVRTRARGLLSSPAPRRARPFLRWVR